MPEQSFLDAIGAGLHWGAAVERGDDLIGNDVNIAARIVDQAAPGETLASDALVVSAAASSRASTDETSELGARSVVASLASSHTLSASSPSLAVVRCSSRCSLAKQP